MKFPIDGFVSSGVLILQGHSSLISFHSRVHGTRMSPRVILNSEPFDSEDACHRQDQKKEHHPMYIEANFLLSVACTISSSTWPSTDSAIGCLDM